MKWFEVKERSAGEKRLILTWYIYKIFGKTIVKVIAFFVTLITFFSSPDLRKCSKKYLRVVNIKPSPINVFKHFLNYAYSQIDKMEVFSGNFDSRNITFYKNADIISLQNCIKNKRGAVCIFSHLGNIDVIRSLLNDDNCGVTIFLSIEQAKIFRSFLNKISVKQNIDIYPVEEIGITTAIEIQQKIEKGGFVFIAGDRISPDSRNKVIEVDFLNKKADFPYGTYKLAELCESSVFFIAAILINDRYELHVQEFQPYKKCAEKMAKSFAEFLAEKTLFSPLQFYHFYDFFKS